MFDVANPNDAISSAKFLDDNIVEVTYLKGKDGDEVTEIYNY